MFRCNKGYKETSPKTKTNFLTFSLGIEFLNEAEKETKQRKSRLGISAVTIRVAVRG